MVFDDYRHPVTRTGNAVLSELEEKPSLQIPRDDQRWTLARQYTVDAKEAEVGYKRTAFQYESTYVKGDLLDDMVEKARFQAECRINAAADRLKALADREGGTSWSHILGGDLLPEATAREVREHLTKMKPEERREHLLDPTVFKALHQAEPFIRERLVSKLDFDMAREQLRPEASREIRRWTAFMEAIDYIREAALQAIGPKKEKPKQGAVKR